MINDNIMSYDTVIYFIIEVSHIIVYLQYYYWLFNKFVKIIIFVTYY